MSSRTSSKAALLALLLVVSSVPDVAAQGKPGATSEVEVKALPRRGAWMNTPLGFTRLSDDSFSITASKQTDLYNPVDDGADVATAPMLLFPADETFVLTTAVKVDFKQEFDGGFLVVYADPNHWVKLLFEKSHYGPFSVCSNVTKGDTDDTVNGDVAKNEVFLRITRAKELFGLYYSLDGASWTYIRYFRFAATGPIKVGFASQSPTGEQCTTVFSKIRYSAKPVRDFWSGEPEEAAAKGE